MANVRMMTKQEKIGEAMRRSLPLLPAEAREQVKAMLTPTSLAIVTGTLIVWAGSHFFGVGEIVDVILLVVGVAFIGMGVFSGAGELYDFTKTAINANTEADLDKAAKHFAKAVNILGISVISAILLKKSATSVVNRGKPQVRPMPNVGPAPASGLRPTITRPVDIIQNGRRILGDCDFWGNIRVSRNQSLTGQRETLYHEWVHSILSPRFGPFRQIRAQLKASAYHRSALMRALEEAIAESYAQLRVYGLHKILIGVSFPLKGGYVTISQLAAEGVAIGNITLGGLHFGIYMKEGVWTENGK
jgi:hypothetical protein